jgi:hypothetical protein
MLSASCTVKLRVCSHTGTLAALQVFSQSEPFMQGAGGRGRAGGTKRNDEAFREGPMQ